MVVRDVLASYMKNSETRFWSIIGFIVLLAVGGWYMYRTHRRNYESKAQLALVQGIEALARAQSNESVEHMWVSAEQVLHEGYRRYSRSLLAPYFLLFEADAIAGQNDIERSRNVLAQALNGMSKHAPLYEPVQIRQALQDVDSSDAAVASRGREALKALAADSKNLYQAMALYFDGLLYFESGDRAKAESVWVPLTEGAKKGSAWSELAAAKLAYQI